jgi:hypothetical protein
MPGINKNLQQVKLPPTEDLNSANISDLPITELEVVIFFKRTHDFCFDFFSLKWRFC